MSHRPLTVADRDIVRRDLVAWYESVVLSKDAILAITEEGDERFRASAAMLAALVRTRGLLP
jgi:hypothetical protein